ncbi:MAG: EamA family transporter [Myxococcota bacterium]
MSKPLLFILVAVVAWGAAPLFDKLGLKEGIDPLLALLVRATTILATLLVLVAVQGKLGEAFKVSSTTAMLLAAGGVTSAVLGMWFYFSALQTMDAWLVVALTSTYPAVTMVLSWLFLRERLTGAQWLGVALIVAGVVLLELATPSSLLSARRPAPTERVEGSTAQDPGT